ncbi:MAG: hypothetical protein KC561_11510 [Myxococcales bacterium]|nr:hypothetical protein [Myxococcales bacterium]
MKRISFLMFTMTMATTLLASSSAQAEDCIPTTQLVESIGLDNSSVWLCPVAIVSETPIDEVAPPGQPEDQPRQYWTRVLDQRLCPTDFLLVRTEGTGWDPTPIWPEDTEILFFVDDARRTAWLESGFLFASADSCRTELDRIVRTDPFSVGEQGLQNDEIILEREGEGGPTMVPHKGVAHLSLLLENAEVATVTWGDILASRGDTSVSGVNYARNTEACGTSAADGPACEFDSDCAICHDGSPCGTLTSRVELIERGEACRQPDSAECEYARERCCGGHCAIRPF